MPRFVKVVSIAAVQQQYPMVLTIDKVERLDEGRGEDKNKHGMDTRSELSFCNVLGIGSGRIPVTPASVTLKPR